jgi:hypothetical protein
MMSTSQYRLTVLICAAVWFLIGMHSPVVHEIVDHGFVPTGRSSRYSRC